MSDTILKQREIPLIIFAVSVLIPILGYHLDVSLLDVTVDTFVEWGAYAANFAFFVGLISLYRSQMRNVTRRTPGQWQYSILTIGIVSLMVVVGFVYSPGFDWLTFNVFFPSQQAMVAYMGFQTIIIIYIGFRVKDLGSALFTLAFIAVTFTYMSFLESYSPIFQLFGNWVNSVPNMAGQRGLLVGIGIGLFSVVIRTILGYERTFMAGAEE
ncbi:hypothetical protein ACFL0D_05375 [Thermoproteota archaeon]